MALASCTASSCPITRRCWIVSRRSALSRSPSVRQLAGIPIHAETMPAISSGGDDLAQQAVLALLGRGLLLLGVQPALRLADLPLRSSAARLRSVAALGVLGVATQPLPFLAQLLDAADRLPFRLPLGALGVGLAAQVAQLTAQVGQAPGCRVGFLGQRGPLDVQAG
jgi:hypothetical protein